MNRFPDQSQMEDRIDLGWEYFGAGWFHRESLFGYWISDDMFYAHQSEYLH